jgi:hypothetical protein
MFILLKYFWSESDLSACCIWLKGTYTCWYLRYFKYWIELLLLLLRLLMVRFINKVGTADTWFFTWKTWLALLILLNSLIWIISIGWRLCLLIGEIIVDAVDAYVSTRFLANNSFVLWFNFAFYTGITLGRLYLLWLLTLSLGWDHFIWKIVWLL